MSYECIFLETKNGVATLTLNRPQALNAMTPEMLAEVVEALTGLASREDVSVVVLTGAGRAFSAGVDLKALQDSGQDLSEGNVGDKLNDLARQAQQLLEDMPQATVAKINGFCFTGGVELMLACDIAISADEAKFGDTHAKIGLRPTWGMTQRLARRVGTMRAKDLSFSARTFTGRDAANYGLVLDSVPLAELDARVADLCTAIAANSSGSVAAYKDLYKKSENAGLAEGLEYEAATDYDISDMAERMAAMLAQLKN